jgi:3-oxoacyl-[acyl-carrier protein] reductase
MNKPLILVTGASKGIGKAIAIHLASSSVTIVCISKNDQKGLMDTVDRIQSKGFSAYPILCDLSNHALVADLFEEIDALNAPIIGLINNAGISLVKLFTETTHEDWMHVINTNLTSVYSMCHFCAKRMLTYHQGQIINISSIWGNEGASMEVAYSASKGGVNSFTRALAKELGPSNIRVNAIACGIIDTTMNHFLSEEENEQLRESISLNRYGTPDEVAQFVKALFEQSPYLNGQIITYDGGRY